MAMMHLGKGRVGSETYESIRVYTMRIRMHALSRNQLVPKIALRYYL
jgi:hypothetical protein